MIEDSIIITDEKYGRGIALDEYKGEYSIVSMRHADNGNNYLDWMFPQVKDRQPSEKSLPWKISLGNKQQAVQRLRMLLDSLGDVPAMGDPNSDIPF